MVEIPLLAAVRLDLSRSMTGDMLSYHVKHVCYSLETGFHLEKSKAGYIIGQKIPDASGAFGDILVRPAEASGIVINPKAVYSKIIVRNWQWAGGAYRQPSDVDALIIRVNEFAQRLQASIDPK